MTSYQAKIEGMCESGASQVSVSLESTEGQIIERFLSHCNDGQYEVVYDSEMPQEGEYIFKAKQSDAEGMDPDHAGNLSQTQVSAFSTVTATDVTVEFSQSSVSLNSQHVVSPSGFCHPGFKVKVLLLEGEQQISSAQGLCSDEGRYQIGSFDNNDLRIGELTVKVESNALDNQQVGSSAQKSIEVAPYMEFYTVESESSTYRDNAVVKISDLGVKVSGSSQVEFKNQQTGETLVLSMQEAISGVEVSLEEGINVISAKTTHNNVESNTALLEIEKKALAGVNIEVTPEDGNVMDLAVNVRVDCEPRINTEVKALDAQGGEFAVFSGVCPEQGEFTLENVRMQDIAEDMADRMGEFQIKVNYPEFPSQEDQAVLTSRPLVILAAGTDSKNGTAVKKAKINLNIDSYSVVEGETVVTVSSNRGHSKVLTYGDVLTGFEFPLEIGSNTISFQSSHRGVVSQAKQITVTRERSDLSVALNGTVDSTYAYSHGEFEVYGNCDAGESVSIELGQSPQTTICPGSGAYSFTESTMDVGISNNQARVYYTFEDVKEVFADVTIKPEIQWSSSTFAMNNQTTFEESVTVSALPLDPTPYSPEAVFSYLVNDVQVDPSSVGLELGLNTVVAKAIYQGVISEEISINITRESAPQVSVNEVSDRYQGDTSDLVVAGGCSSGEGEWGVEIIREDDGVARSLYNQACEDNQWQASFDISQESAKTMRVVVTQKESSTGQVFSAEASFEIMPNNMPYISISNPGDYEQNSSDLHFSGSCSYDEGDLVFEIKKDDGNYLVHPDKLECESGFWSYISSDRGMVQPDNYIAKISQVDNETEITLEEEAFFSVSPDLTAPEVDLRGIDPFEQYSRESVTLTGYCQESNRPLKVTAGTKIIIDGTCPEDNNFSVVIIDHELLNTPGVFTVKATHADADGNYKTASVDIEVLEDETSPILDISLLTAHDGELADGTKYHKHDTELVFSGGCESGHVVRLKNSNGTVYGAQGQCDSGSYSIALSPFTLSGGENSLAATQTDEAGNTGTSSYISVMVFDKPEVNILTYDDNFEFESQNTMSVTGECESEYGTVVMQISSSSNAMIQGGSEEANCENGTFSKEMDLSFMPAHNQTHEYKLDVYQSMDGLTGEDFKLFNVLPDETDPLIGIKLDGSSEDGQEYGETHSADLEFSGTCDQNLAISAGIDSVTRKNPSDETQNLRVLTPSVSCADGGTFSFSVSVSELGGYDKFVAGVSQTDSSGNKGVASIHFEVKDETPPALAVDPIADFNEREQDSLQISGTCSEPGTDNLTVRVDDIIVFSGDCAESGAYSVEVFNEEYLSVGQHSVAVRHIDNDNNEVVKNEEYTVRNLSPVASITSSPDDYTQGDFEQLTFSGTCTPEEGDVIFSIYDYSDPSSSPLPVFLSESVDCLTGNWEKTVAAMTEDKRYQYVLEQDDLHPEGDSGYARGYLNVYEDNTAPNVSISLEGESTWGAGQQMDDEVAFFGICQSSGAGDVTIIQKSSTGVESVLGTVPCLQGGYRLSGVNFTAPSEYGEYTYIASQSDTFNNTGTSTESVVITVSDPPAPQFDIVASMFNDPSEAPAEDEDVNNVKFSPDGKTMAVAFWTYRNTKRDLALYSLANGKFHLSYEYSRSDSSYPSDMEFTPDGSYIVQIFRDDVYDDAKDQIVYHRVNGAQSFSGDITSFYPQTSSTGSNPKDFMKFFDNGNFLVLAMQSQHYIFKVVWDSDGLSLIKDEYFQRFGYDITGIVDLPNRHFLVTYAHDSSIRSIIFEIDENEKIKDVYPGRQNHYTDWGYTTVYSLFKTDDEKILASTEQGIVEFTVDPYGEVPISTVTVDGNVPRGYQFSEPNQMLLSGTGTGITGSYIDNDGVFQGVSFDGTPPNGSTWRDMSFREGRHGAGVEISSEGLVVVYSKYADEFYFMQK